MQKLNITLLLRRSPLLRGFIRMGLTDALLNAHSGSNDPAYWRQVQSTGVIERPNYLWFDPTIRCNLGCRFCHQSSRRRSATHELDKAAISRLFAQSAACGIRAVDLIGGEIFLRSDIFDILDAVQRCGLRVKLGSNGTLIDASVADRLTRYDCIESITVSVDGPEAIHDGLRGVPGTYEKAVRGLRFLVKKNFVAAVCAILTPQGTSVIDFLMELAHNLGIDRLAFIAEMFYSNADIDASGKMLDAHEPQPFFVEVKEGVDSAAYAETMAAYVNRIKEQRARRGVFTVILPRIAAEFPREFFSGRLRESLKLMCKPMSVLNVMENGDVRICPFINITCGNIVNDSIEHIWNNERMRSLRKTILSSNLLPICSRCCGADYI